MGFQEAVTACLSKYVGFEGRAVRSEYWYWVLFIVIVTVVLNLVTAVLPGALGSIIGVLSGLFALGTFLPGLAVSVRRLHDVDRSGWFLLIAFIPLIGALVLIYFMVQPGTPGRNRFDGGVQA